MFRKTALLAIATMPLCTSCSTGRAETVRGDGDVVSVERSVGEYDAVRVGGAFDVELVDGPEGELVLRGEENLLEHVVTTVEAGALAIRVR